MRLRSIFMASAFLLLAFSCETPEKPDEVKPEIQVPSESQKVFASGINFGENAGSSSQISKVSFIATDAWAADVTETKASSWLSVQPSSGGAGTVVMTVTAQPNSGETARSATVTIRCGIVSKSFSVTQAGNSATVVAVESVTLDKTDLSLEEGQSQTLIATVHPDNATVNTVTWSSSNMASATVSDLGTVTAVKEGAATITATAGGKTATCNVTVTREGGSGDVERNALIALYNALDGPHWMDNTNWCTDKPLSEWYGVYTNGEHVTNIELYYNGLKGTIPPEIGAFSHLRYLSLQGNQITGGIPSEIGQLKSLLQLDLFENQFTGSIPIEICRLENLERLFLLDNPGLSGPIPAELGNMRNLKEVNISRCNFTGNLPAELTNLNDLETFFRCSYNPLSGIIPAAFANWKYWTDGWGEMVTGTNLDWSETSLHCPEFSVVMMDGTIVTSDILKENELTVFFQWGSFCPFSPTMVPLLRSAWNHFGDKGLGIIGWSVDDDEASARQYVADMGMPWQNFFTREPLYHGNTYNRIISAVAPKEVNRGYPNGDVPSFTAFDKEGKLVYSHCRADNDYSETLLPFIAQWFGEPDWKADDEKLYESTDFSRDGNVTVLQEATVGKGIDLVFLGDGYSDRKIADGTYANTVQEAMEAFFTIEPYNTLRSLFNVKMIDVVSLNEGFGKGFNTVFSTEWKGDTLIEGDDATVVQYVLKAVPEDRVDDCVAVVLINSSLYAGTASFLIPAQFNDWGGGMGIAYFPSNPDYLGYLVRHEAGGHAFAKLADEYVLDEGRIDNESIQNTQRVTETYGWYKNVDFTDDPSLVRWRYFLEDERYAQEDVGIFEGAYYYGQGAFRPSFDSIMNSDREGGFNAVSREAIWYRAHKAAYGPDWEYSYEDFVAYDAVNRTSAASAQKKKEHRNFVEKELEPLSPPRMVNKTWRELLASPSTP